MELKYQKGFTLIELLVVIAIISLLSSVVLAALNDARAKARDARRLEDLRQINNALQLYLQDHAEAPIIDEDLSTDITYTSSGSGGWGGLETLLSPYIKKLPMDPLNGETVPVTGNRDGNSDSYRYFYRRLDVHAYGPCENSGWTIPACNDKRLYILTANFEKRDPVRASGGAIIPVSTLFGLSYPQWP